MVGLGAVQRVGRVRRGLRVGDVAAFRRSGFEFEVFARVASVDLQVAVAAEVVVGGVGGVAPELEA